MKTVARNVGMKTAAHNVVSLLFESKLGRAD
jgi:hypothetical protein